MSVKAVKEKYEDYLLKLSGVTGVGLNGSIIIYVEKLTPQLTKVLPRKLDDIPVRIIETGKIVPMSIKAVPVAHAIYADRTAKHRPAPGGVSVGHPEITAGTLTARAVDKTDGSIVGLGNNHVVALDWGELHTGEKGDSALQPGPYDGGKDPDDKIGELKRWIPVKLDEPNLIDGGVFSSEQLSDIIKDVGKPSESIEPYPGMKVVGSGRTSGVVYSKIVDVNAAIKVEGWGICTFKDQVSFIPPILAPGDSGMWIGNADTWRTVSVGFAGSSVISFGNRAKVFENLLNVEIIPPTKPLPLWGLGMVVGIMAYTGLSLMRGGEGAI